MEQGRFDLRSWQLLFWKEEASKRKGSIMAVSEYEMGITEKCQNL